MAINKVGSKGIEDGAVAAVDFKDGDITADKLNSTLDLSTKTVTLPNTSVTSDMLANTTIANAKLSNSSITAVGSSISLGASVNLNNQFVDWQSKVTSDGSTVTTMVSGRGYFIDNTSAAGLVKLPASASRGDFVAIKDYAGNFGTNNLTIQRNSHNIQGAANNSVLSTNRASVVLVYVDATKGWLYWEESNVDDLQKNIRISATGGTVTTSGDFKIHTFTGDGTFCVSAGAGPFATVDYLVIAGGGAGGGMMGSGGGAGGFRESHSTPVSGSYTASPLATPTGLPVSIQAYPVTVGGGGALTAPGGGYPSGGGQQGSNSVFSTITSAGGGGRATNPGSGNGAGGSGSGYPRYTGTGASGNSPPVSPPQGNPGGDVPSSPFNQDNAGSGGGGAGAAGGDANSTPCSGILVRAGNGGNGTATAITGSSVTRAGGGGGGTRTQGTTRSPSAPSGGTGGGGNGGYGSPGSGNGNPGTSGTANTGSGGGAGHYHACNPPAPFPNPSAQDRDLPGGTGGKGLVVIRYKFQ